MLFCFYASVCRVIHVLHQIYPKRTKWTRPYSIHAHHLNISVWIVPFVSSIPSVYPYFCSSVPPPPPPSPHPLWLSSISPSYRAHCLWSDASALVLSLCLSGWISVFASSALSAWPADLMTSFNPTVISSFHSQLALVFQTLAPQGHSQRNSFLI